MVAVKEDEGLRVKPDLKGKVDKNEKLKPMDKNVSSEESEDETSSEESEDSSSESSETTSTSTTDSDEKVVGKKTEMEEESIGKRKGIGGQIQDKLNTSKNSQTSNSPKGRPKRRRRKPRQVTICLTNCRYEIVRNVAKQFNLLEVGEDESWNIYWTDFSVSLDRAMDMRRYQLVNHFPGMNEICRKDLLSRNLNRMKRLFQNDYDIFPKTWSLPSDLGELQAYAHTRKNKTYICKPEMGCQGRGIFLIRSIKDLNPFGKIICQLYVSRPFLIDNLKFDLRIYVLMTTCDPLRIYVYKEGLARFATAKYKPPTNSNTENSYMHLTNYAVNKYSRDYVVDDEGGSKRKLTAVYRWLEQRSYDTEELMNNIDDVIIKTIISAHPILKHNYRTCYPNHDLCSACFEILGFDVLLDYKLKPYVLEVNHSPSFHTDAKLDKEIKEALLHDTLAMLNMKLLDRFKVESDDRKRIQERLLHKQNETKKRDGNNSEGLSIEDQQFQWELDHSGGYRLIYPSPSSDKYEKYFEQNLSSLYHETTASQARANCTRNQMEEYNKMKQQEERKRIALAQSNLAIERAKEKVRPESPADPEKPKIKNKIKVSRKKDVGCFVPCPIVADEELDRMKSLMQRGMLIRSLGIEIQVFKLLCQVGNLKPEEEKLFRRMHSFPGNNFPAPSSRGFRNAIPGPMEHMQRGDAASTISHQKQMESSLQQFHETTNKGDFKYPTNISIQSSNIQSPNSYEPSSYSPKFEHGKMGMSALMKNPYNVPYNSPAQFGNVQQHRPKTSNSSPNGLTISQISNFMDKINPSNSHVTINDLSVTPSTPHTYHQRNINEGQALTERRFYPRITGADSQSHNFSNHSFISSNISRYLPAPSQHQGNTLPIRTMNHSYPTGTGNDGSSSLKTSHCVSKGEPNASQTLTTTGIFTSNKSSDANDPPIQNLRMHWASPQLTNHQLGVPNQVSSKFHTPDSNTSTPRQFRPQARNWHSHYMAMNSARNFQPGNNSSNAIMSIKRIKSQKEETPEPVLCTQMFFNDKTFSTGQSVVSTSRQTHEGRSTNSNFLRGVGNVALLRSGRSNVPANRVGAEASL